MRSVLRLLTRFLHLLIFVLLLVIAAVAGVVWLTLPGGDLRAGIPGLLAPVSIDIDPDGVPRIRAETDRDAAAALGFLHARERMGQMELMRRAASGELSELAGPATLRIDRLMRVLGVRRSAEADLAALPAPTRDLLEAYAAGVNAWIAEHGRFSGLEFVAFGAPRPWTPVDSLLWGKTMGLYLSGNWRTELARLSLAGTLPQATIDELWPVTSANGRPQAVLSNDPALARLATTLATALPRFPEAFTLPATASNEWAVDGTHTQGGAPLLAGDPHLGFSLPGIWYLARIETPERVLVGATAPGVPFLVLGHNGRIAWTFTTTGADVQDLFVETAGPDGTYLTPDGSRPFVTRDERIHVRGQPDEVITIRETRHGPVVSDLVAPQGPVLALAMANLAPGDTAASGLLALNAAGSVSEAGQAAPLISSPVQNLLVADRDGIGLFVTGRVPIRRAGDGGAPAPGADGSHDWTGFASGPQLPHVVAPASGRLVNANDRIAPPDFPVFLGRDWYGDFRARRIREMLDRTGRPTQADFVAMQTDDLDPFARDVLPRLRSVQAPEGLPRAALDLLADWDGRMSAELPQPLIFNAWMYAFDLALLTRIGVPESEAVAPMPDLVSHALSPDGAHWCGGDCDKLLAETLARAVASLARRYGSGPASWRWGTAHQAVFAHPLLGRLPVIGALATARIASPGDDATVGRGGLRGPDAAGVLGDDAFASVHGASFRAVYDLADLERSLFVVAPGQSGHPASPLSRNFMPRWRQGSMITLESRATAVTTRIVLTPTHRR